jgi:hypothetical protein
MRLFAFGLIGFSKGYSDEYALSEFSTLTQIKVGLVRTSEREIMWRGQICCPATPSPRNAWRARDDSISPTFAAGASRRLRTSFKSSQFKPVAAWFRIFY